MNLFFVDHPIISFSKLLLGIFLSKFLIDWTSFQNLNAVGHHLFFFSPKKICYWFITIDKYDELQTNWQSNDYKHYIIRL